MSAGALPHEPSTCAGSHTSSLARPRLRATRKRWASCLGRRARARSAPRSRSSGRSETRTTGTSTMSSLGYSAIELLEGLEDAQSGLRDLEEAVEGMKNPPDDLVEA